MPSFKTYLPGNMAQARALVERAAAEQGVSVTLSDCVTEGGVCLMVYEKYFYRNGSAASLSVTLVQQEGRTAVLAAGTGGGAGLLNLAWGANKSFVARFEQTLQRLAHNG